MIFFQFFLSLAVIASSNLICNGDFESYVLTDSFEGDYYLEIASDINCWYNKNVSQIIEIKKIAVPFSSQGSQLTSDRPYTLCQKVALITGQKYNLGYSLLCPNKLTNMKLKVYVNQVQISQLLISTSNTFGSQEINFTAQVNSNEICFDETHSVNFFYPLKNYVGGVIDNITLLRISNTVVQPTNTTNSTFNDSVSNVPIYSYSTVNQSTSNSSLPASTPAPTPNMLPSFPTQNGTIDQNLQYAQFDKVHVIIHFVTIIKEVAWEIELQSDMPYEDWIQQYLQMGLRIFIEGEEQKDYTFEVGENNNLKVVTKVYRSYDISEIQMVVEDKEQFQDFLEFEIYVDGKQIYFNILNEDERQTIQEAEKIASIMPQVVFKIYEVISSSLSSFFVLSLFNFWNLSLMYNFLLLKTIPNFSRNIFEVMLNLLYQKGSITTWITKFFTGDDQESFQFLKQTGIQQKMPNFISGYAWFGEFGLSTILLVNNFDFLVIGGFLILKLLIVKFLLKCLSKQTKLILGIKERLGKIFLMEIIAFSPFMIISAFSTVIKAPNSFHEKRQICIQCILLFSCFMLLPLLIFASVQYMKSLEKERKELKKIIINEPENIKIDYERVNLGINKQLAQEKMERNIMFSDLILNITIPSVIWLGNAQGFLFFNILIIIGKFVVMGMNFRKISVIEKIYAIFLNLIWLIHHLNFITFYVLEKIKEKNEWDQSFMPKMTIYCGILAFMVVLIGGAIELLKFFFDFIGGLVIIVKKLKLLWKIRREKRKVAEKQILSRGEIIFTEQQNFRNSIDSENEVQQEQKEENKQEQKSVKKSVIKLEIIQGQNPAQQHFIPVTIVQPKAQVSSQNDKKKSKLARKMKIWAYVKQKKPKQDALKAIEKEGKQND